MTEPSIFELADNIHNLGFGDHLLGVQFYLRPVEDAERTRETGRKCFTDREYVRIMTPGDRFNVVDRPVQRTGNRSTDDRLRFPKQYERFAQSQAQPEHDGLPLAVWPGIPGAMVEELKYLHIYTVEQLAELSDTHVGKIPRGQLIKAKAAEYVNAMKDAAAVNKMQAALEERDVEIEALKQAVEQQAIMLAQLTEQAPMSTVPIKRKRRTRAEMAEAKADG